MPLGSKDPLTALASQLLAGLPLMQVQEKEQEDEGKDETDHEGLDVRPCLGEQDPHVLEQQMQQLEDLARSGEEWGSEAEELAFKIKVSAVQREKPPASRMFLVPKPRFKSAVGGAGGQQGPAVGGQDGGVDVSMDMHLHMSVLSSRGGTQDFGLHKWLPFQDVILAGDALVVHPWDKVLVAIHGAACMATSTLSHG